MNLPSQGKELLSANGFQVERFFVLPEEVGQIRLFLKQG